MKLIISNSCKAIKFTNIFNNLKNFTETTNMIFSENGLYIQGMDKSQCCLFELKINNDWFDNYEFQKSKDAEKIGISNSIMHKILNTRRDNQNINISYLGNPDKLSIHFVNEETEENEKNEQIKTEFNKKIDIPLMDLESQLLSVPTTEYEAEITISSNMMREIVDELSIFNDKLEICLNEENINLKSSGVDGEMGITIKNDDIIEYAIIENGNLKQSYSIKFFKLMTGFNKLSSEVKLGFSVVNPMLMLYSLETNNSKSNYIKFYLAPYIND